MPRTELAERLHALRLSRTADDLDDFLARATKQRWSPHVLLEELARQEHAERERRSLERRLRAAHLGRFKPIDAFDWSWPQKIDRPVLERALSGALVRERENLILVAAQGLGKTLLARNIAHAAVLQGYSALFIEASRMLLDLGAQDSARALERRLRHYARPALLCVDTMPAPPICCSKSSRGAMSKDPSSSPPISRFPTGPASSPTPAV
jgi:DNA replication protein DnaC